MISQIKLHLTNPQKPKSNKEGNQNLHTCKHDFFSLPIDLEQFKEGIFHYSDMQLTRHQEAFMETAFYFDSWEEENQQSATGGDILVVNGELQECELQKKWFAWGRGWHATRNWRASLGNLAWWCATARDRPSFYSRDTPFLAESPTPVHCTACILISHFSSRFSPSSLSTHFISFCSNLAVNMVKKDPIDLIRITSANQCLQEFELLKGALSIEESEDTWQKIDASLKRFSAVIRGGACDYPEEFLRCWKETEIVRGLVNAMCTERTRLSGTALDLVGLTSRLGSYWDSAVPFYVPSIIKLLGRASKIYVARATMTLISLIKGSKSVAFLPYLNDGLSEKSLSMRIGCSEALFCCLSSILENDGNQPQSSKSRPANKDSLNKRLNDIEKAIATGGRDRDPKVRVIFKRIWELYEQHWPSRAVNFSQPLTPTIRRYLGISVASAPAMPAPATSALSGRAHHSLNSSKSNVNSVAESAREKLSLNAHQRAGSKNLAEKVAQTIAKNVEPSLKSQNTQISVPITTNSGDLATLRKAMMVPLPPDDPKECYEQKAGRVAGRADALPPRPGLIAEGSLHKPYSSGSIMKRSNSTMRAQRVPFPTPNEPLNAACSNAPTLTAGRAPLQPSQSTSHAKDTLSKSLNIPHQSGSNSSHPPVKPNASQTASNTTKASLKPSRPGSDSVPTNSQVSLPTRPLPRRAAGPPPLQHRPGPPLAGNANVSNQSNTQSSKVAASEAGPIIKQTRKAFKPKKNGQKALSGFSAGSSQASSTKVAATVTANLAPTPVQAQLPSVLPEAPQTETRLDAPKMEIAPMDSKTAMLPEDPKINIVLVDPKMPTAPDHEQFTNALHIPALNPLPSSPTPPPQTLSQVTSSPPIQAGFHPAPSPPPQAEVHSAPSPPPQAGFHSASSPSPKTSLQSASSSSPQSPFQAVPSPSPQTIFQPTSSSPPQSPLREVPSPPSQLDSQPLPTMEKPIELTTTSGIGLAIAASEGCDKTETKLLSTLNCTTPAHEPPSHTNRFLSIGIETPGPKICTRLPDDLIVPMSIPLPPSPNSPFIGQTSGVSPSKSTSSSLRKKLGRKSIATQRTPRGITKTVTCHSEVFKDKTNDAALSLGRSRQESRRELDNNSSPLKIVKSGEHCGEDDCDGDETQKGLDQEGLLVDFDHEDTIWIPRPPTLHQDLVPLSSVFGINSTIEEESEEEEGPEEKRLRLDENESNKASEESLPSSCPVKQVGSLEGSNEAGEKVGCRDHSIFQWDQGEHQSISANDDSTDKTISCLKEPPPFLEGDLTVNDGRSFLTNFLKGIRDEDQSTPASGMADEISQHSKALTAQTAGCLFTVGAQYTIALFSLPAVHSTAQYSSTQSHTPLPTLSPTCSDSKSDFIPIFNPAALHPALSFPDPSWSPPLTPFRPAVSLPLLRGSVVAEHIGAAVFVVVEILDPLQILDIHLILIRPILSGLADWYKLIETNHQRIALVGVAD
ncbi:hypothetical protein O181_006840 [Austropuccinia psidii MF-1]|uniref:CLASP N-terminal domain-containing protein n=1 Tax=Austropuccinia psidii MF-1 TaxID=1389203 RepID=A0A9Q3GH94_9BASI|nr:hypothetical protein [Austropuccinia psidii MF-1]